MALVRCHPADLMFGLASTRWHPVTLPLVRTHPDVISLAQFLSANVRTCTHVDQRPLASGYHAILGPRIWGPPVYQPKGRLASVGVRATSAGGPWPLLLSVTR